MDAKGYEALQSVLAKSDARIVPKPADNENVRFLSAEVRETPFHRVEILSHYTLNLLDRAGFIEKPNIIPDQFDKPTLRVLGITQHHIVFEDVNSPPAQPVQHIDFPEHIGEDYEQWQKYHEAHGKEAYKYRRLYEETSRLLTEVDRYAKEHNIDLPNPGPDFT